MELHQRIVMKEGLHIYGRVYVHPRLMHLVGERVEARRIPGAPYVDVYKDGIFVCRAKERNTPVQMTFRGIL